MFTSKEVAGCNKMSRTDTVNTRDAARARLGGQAIASSFVLTLGSGGFSIQVILGIQSRIRQFAENGLNR